MKMKKAAFLMCAVLVLTAILAVGAFAQKNVFTQHKVVLYYDKPTSTLNADIYISNGSAIVGYCSFVYDSDVLQLRDSKGNAVPTENVPKFGEDGQIYLTDIVSAHSGIVVTDIGKGTPTLVNPEEGYLMFAWFLPSNIPSIEATDDVDVLIASLSFDVIADITEEDFDKETFWVADNEITDKIGGWYPGIVVMNAEQQQFNFDGSVEDGDLFLLEYELSGLKQSENPSVPGKYPENEPEKEPESQPDNEPEKEPESQPDNEPEKEPESQPDNEPEKEPESQPDNEPEKEPESQPDNEPEKDDDKTNTSSPLLNKNASFKADFNLEYTKTENTIHIQWDAPENITNIDNFTAVICDEDFNVIRKVDIFRSSTSYTFKNLKDNFNYKLYFYAATLSGTYSSDVISVTTDKSDDPEVIAYTVTYNAGKGKLYGLKNEQVLFGEKLTKVPEVSAPEGKYFMGWSVDGVNTVNTDETKVYKDMKLTALYTDTRFSSPASYITGYTDGTFKPDGSITRAEAAVLISRISPLYNENGKYCHSFTDCVKGSWYESAVAFCSSNGFITGYLDGTFKPTGNITRAEFATILVRVFGFEDAVEINVFSDIESHWGCPYISRLYGAGIVSPDENGMFRPNEKLTRKDAVVMINKCIGLSADTEKIDNYLNKNGFKFTDLPMYSDYFYPIMAATLKAEDLE